MELNGLSHYCPTSNRGGFHTLEYAPIHWISSNAFEPLATAQGNWLYNILFTTGTWLKAPLLPKKRAWDEQSRSNAQGPWYAQQLEANTPKLRPTVTAELERMEKMRFLLKIEDKNGQPWILGSLEAPFEFKADASTGNSGDLNYYALRFSCSTPHRARGFNPIFNI